MYEDKDELIIRCSCGDISHPVHLFVWVDDWCIDCNDGGWVNDVKVKKHSKYKFCDLYIELQIEDAGFFTRIKNAISYIFKQRKFWHHGSTLLNLLSPEGDGELRRTIAFLTDVLKKAEKCKKHNESVKE